jgi:hypothetical protein
MGWFDAFGATEMYDARSVRKMLRAIRDDVRKAADLAKSGKVEECLRYLDALAHVVEKVADGEFDK